MPYGEDDDGTWMTKRELASIRRISVASADRLARRMKWRKQPGNDGRARVLVPTDWATCPKDGATDWALVKSESGPPAPTDKPKDSPTDLSRITSSFDAALTVLREQVEAERERANWAELARDAARTELMAEQEARGKAEGTAEAAGERADQAEERADRAEQELAGAQEALAGAEARLREAEAARTEFWSRSRFARLRAVWRGRA